MNAIAQRLAVLNITTRAKPKRVLGKTRRAAFAQMLAIDKKNLLSGIKEGRNYKSEGSQIVLCFRNGNKPMDVMANGEPEILCESVERAVQIIELIADLNNQGLFEELFIATAKKPNGYGH